MDVHNLVATHANVPFSADGQDEHGVYMILNDHRIHVRHDDSALVLGLPLHEAWPLVDKIETVPSKVATKG